VLTQSVATLEPKEIVLRSGKAMKLRRLQPNDAQALFDFFQEVPGYDRFYLRDDVTSRAVIDDWCAHIDPLRVLPLVAVVDGSIIAEGTLHRRRHPGRRHIGEIRIVVDPKYRGRGLGTHIMHQLLEHAYAQQMERVIIELVSGKEEPAIRVAREVGFRRVAEFKGHIRDMDGNYHDLLVLEMDLKTWYQVDEASNF